MSILRNSKGIFCKKKTTKKQNTKLQELCQIFHDLANVQEELYEVQFYYPILHDIDLPPNPTKVHHSITQVNGNIDRKFPYHSNMSLNIFIYKFIECLKSINIQEHLKRIIKDDTKMSISLQTEYEIDYQEVSHRI